jgi:hypothetical protein
VAHIYDENEHRAQRSAPSRIQSGDSAQEWRALMMKMSTARAPEHRSTLSTPHLGISISLYQHRQPLSKRHEATDNNSNNQQHQGDQHRGEKKKEERREHRALKTTKGQEPRRKTRHNNRTTSASKGKRK